MCEQTITYSRDRIIHEMVNPTVEDFMKYHCCDFKWVNYEGEDEIDVYVHDLVNNHLQRRILTLKGIKKTTSNSVLTTELVQEYIIKNLEQKGE